MTITAEDVRKVVREELEAFFQENPIGVEFPTPNLGEEFPIKAWAQQEISRRQLDVGPALQALIDTAPSRVLYRRAGEEASISDVEEQLLQFNRALIESEPQFFTYLLADLAVIREARDLNNAVIPGVLVRPSVNQTGTAPRVFSRAYMEREVSRWLTTRINAANLADNQRRGPDFDDGAK